MPEQMKTLSLRIPVEMARMVEMFSETDGITQIQFIRDAIDIYIEHRRNDPAFQALLQAQIEVLKRFQLGE